MSELQLFVKRLSPDAILPVRGSEHAAGYDLSSIEHIFVTRRSHARVKTGISIQMPAGVYGRVAPRSGLALKYGIDVGAGVIDYDYTGEVGVVLFNHSDIHFEVKKGDRIAQLILEKNAIAQVVETETLPDTQRGTGGFGSTGVQEIDEKKK